MNKFIKLLRKDSTAMYLTAFCIPVFVLVLVYIFRGVYPFGDACYLRSDMYHQYITFLAALHDKLKTGGSLLYSWDIGSGVNFIALFAYYLATPFNWITVIFPQEHLIEYLSAFMIIKTGLCGVTFSYYISKRHGSSNLIIAAISVFYALSGYMCSYNWNVMWLDCIVLFPLIIFGLERLIKGGKPTLYCVTLALSILSNYYISIMICIFCVLYFIMYSLCACDFSKPLKVLKSIFNFGLFSLLAGGMAACLLLPEMSALMLTASGEFNFPEKLSNYFSIFEMISRQLIMVDPAIFSAHEPNIYGGIIVFLLVPFYALNPKTSTKEKIGRFAFIFMFYLSFNLNIPNYIWHGLHFPNSLPCRQSFIFNFLLLAMSYEGFLYAKSNQDGKVRKELWAILGGVVLLFLIIEETFVSSTYSYIIIYVSLFFIALYALILTLYRKGKCHPAVIATILLVVVFFEAFINTQKTSIFTTTRSAYLADNQAISTVLNTVAAEDDGFYRVEKLTRRTKNDSAWHHYHGLSIFSSTANAGYANLLASLGGERSTNSYGYYGATPLVEALTNVKYVLGTEGLETPFRTLVTSADNTYLYRNNYNFGMGYMVPTTLEEDWIIKVNNPFIIQNNFASFTTGISPIFSSVPYSTSGNSIKFSPKSDMQVYACITSSGKNFTVTYTDDLGQEIKPPVTYSMNQKYVIDLGYLDSTYNVTITSEDSSTINLYLYSINEDIFKEFCTEFGQSSFQVSSYDDTHMSGTINVKEDGLFVSAIVYEEGWTVLVDGVEVETEAFMDALIAFPLASGTHEISFSYYPKGLKEGLIISATCFITFLLITIIPFIIRKKKAKAALPKATETSESPADEAVVQETGTPEALTDIQDSTNSDS
ncbi:MAG: YfhO family protein [Lachnospiraceae bacterium]|nr:YfhO family protein [Lachnospiraceae bacterium]